MAQKGPRAACRIVDGIPHRRLHAHAGDDIVGVLDFLVTETVIEIQVVFVKPHFRSQGIATLLIDSLRARYPGKQVRCATVH